MLSARSISSRSMVVSRLSGERCVNEQTIISPPGERGNGHWKPPPALLDAPTVAGIVVAGKRAYGV